MKPIAIDDVKVVNLGMGRRIYSPAQLEEFAATLPLLDTQCRSYTIRVWLYETFIVSETVIDRYLAVET
jgi:hypothetical protein